jgi:hypothetical protein
LSFELWALSFGLWVVSFELREEVIKKTHDVQPCHSERSEESQFSRR